MNHIHIKRTLDIYFKDYPDRMKFLNTNPLFAMQQKGKNILVQEIDASFLSHVRNG